MFQQRSSKRILREKAKIEDNRSQHSTTIIFRVLLPDTDPAIQLLLEELAITYSKLSAKEVALYIMVEDFQYHWQKGLTKEYCLPIAVCVLATTRLIARTRTYLPCMQ